MTKLGSVESEPIPTRALRTVRPTIAAWTFSRPHVTRPSPPSGTRSCGRALTSGSPVTAYSFPSRSPDPHHLAVLTRSDFVGAACRPHRHHPGRTAPSFTALLRQDRQRRSHTPSRIHSASRRTQRRAKNEPFTTG